MKIFIILEFFLYVEIIDSSAAEHFTNMTKLFHCLGSTIPIRDFSHFFTIFTCLWNDMITDVFFVGPLYILFTILTVVVNLEDVATNCFTEILKSFSSIT